MVGGIIAFINVCIVIFQIFLFVKLDGLLPVSYFIVDESSTEYLFVELELLDCIFTDFIDIVCPAYSDTIEKSQWSISTYFKISMANVCYLYHWILHSVSHEFGKTIRIIFGNSLRLCTNLGYVWYCFIAWNCCNCSSLY